MVGGFACCLVALEGLLLVKNESPWVLLEMIVVLRKLLDLGEVLMKPSSNFRARMMNVSSGQHQLLEPSLVGSRLAFRSLFAGSVRCWLVGCLKLKLRG